MSFHAVPGRWTQVDTHLNYQHEARCLSYHNAIWTQLNVEWIFVNFEWTVAMLWKASFWLITASALFQLLTNVIELNWSKVSFKSLAPIIIAPTTDKFASFKSVNERFLSPRKQHIILNLLPYANCSVVVLKLRSIVESNKVSINFVATSQSCLEDNKLFYQKISQKESDRSASARSEKC